MASSTISLTISHRGTVYPLSLQADSTLATLQAQLEELTSVPALMQKLIFKGKKWAHGSQEITLLQAGFKDGMKVQMLGSTVQEIGGMKAAEDEQKRKQRILSERALKAPVKVRSTGASNSISSPYVFRSLQPLAHLPNPSSAFSVLERLSNDPAIRHVMQKHRLSVGVLTELAPHEHEEGLLGLNVNAGQVIKLRIRTEDYTGFRAYLKLRMILCHELAHNVWSDHNNNFKELNSQLNREVVEFERSVREGTNYLVGGRDSVYEPSSELEAQAVTESHVHILGEGSGHSMDDSREERRRRMLEAAMIRLRKDEEELEQSCGTAGSSAAPE